MSRFTMQPTSTVAGDTVRGVICDAYNLCERCEISCGEHSTGKLQAIQQQAGAETSLAGYRYPIFCANGYPGVSGWTAGGG
ncbi:hypothetical protein AB6G95_19295 [Proteus vulgaris]|uniref:hypothetical protein n=1 Tax=Proteus vulgaris TaxID=585 RepID=UPI0034DD8570